jgi:adenylate cyclase
VGIEIERKFLVLPGFRERIARSTRITQGYLSSVPERTVRVRICGDQGYLTIKGASDGAGATRSEWEWELALDDARELLQLCEPGVIDKTRHLVPVDNLEFEVDEFHGDNEGLIVAELELANEGEAFARPEWLGEEVTGEARYYNSMLSRNPFSSWPR